MAQNLVINGVTYQDVPEVDIPKSGGGTAVFTDTSDATLDSNAKMLSGVTAYANGTKYTGSITTKTSSDLTASGATVTAGLMKTEQVFAPLAQLRLAQQ